MEHIFVRSSTLPFAYHESLKQLLRLGQMTEASDWLTGRLEVSATIVVDNPLDEPMISKCFPGGPRELEEYVLEMTAGIMDFAVDYGKMPYTYHRRMVDWGKYHADQLDFVVEELRRNPDSTRAVVCIRDAEDVASDDPACLQHMQFTIRKGKLNLSVLFRSNDAVRAAYMNMFGLVMIQKMIADRLGVQVGTYTHQANSYHAYRETINLLRRYVEKYDESPVQLVAYLDGEDGWGPLMADEREGILKNVKELEERYKNEN